MRQQLLKRPLHYRTTIQNLLIVYFPNQDNFNAACFMTKPILWKLYVKLDCLRKVLKRCQLSELLTFFKKYQEMVEILKL